MSIEELYPMYTARVVDSIVILREAKGITQRDLAERTNLSQSTIARIESGRVTPRLDTMINILLVLDATLTVVDFDEHRKTNN